MMHVCVEARGLNAIVANSSYWQSEEYDSRDEPVYIFSFRTPAQGAETSIYVSSSPEVEGISSKYFMDCKMVSSSPSSYDAENARLFFDRSLELTGAPPLPSR